MLYQRDPDINVLKENGSIFLSHGVVQMSMDSPGLVGFLCLNTGLPFGIHSLASPSQQEVGKGK